MRRVSYEIKREVNEQLEQLNRYVNGVVHENRLHFNEGEVIGYEFDEFKVLIYDVDDESPIEFERIVTESNSSVTIQFSEIYSTTPQKNRDGNFRFDPGAGKFIEIEISRKYLRMFLDSNHPLVEGLDSGTYHECKEILTPDMKRIFHALYSLDKSKVIFRNLIFSRVWELTTLLMEQLMFKSSISSLNLNEQTATAVMKTKDIIMSNLANLPSTTDISRSVGVSNTLLRSSFKEVFGQSIYQYYITHRLEEARRLILTGDYSVSEVGYMIGYTHLGHFSSAFRKEFGVLPKKFAKGVL